VENRNLHEKLKRVKTPTTMLRQAQHDKASEASQLAGRIIMKRNMGF
jgi:hypothetical protein